MTIEGYFDVSELKNESMDYVQKLLQFNGVAILLPYLRAIIAQTTTLAGKSPVNLPLINVVDLYKKDAKEDEK